MERYELHSNKFTKMQPFSLHYDGAKTVINGNWHDSVELLLITKGSSVSFLGVEKVTAREGDIIFINSNTVHKINSASDERCEYYCLIVSIDFLEEFGLYSEDTIISSLIKSDEGYKLFRKIIEEQNSDSFYPQAITALIISLFVYLLRNHSVSLGNASASAKNNKTLMVRKALSYMKSNFNKKIQIQDIADYVNYSTYYLSHTFKEITGHSIVYHLNLLRCRHANNMLSHGNISISAVATESGFDNIQYFTRTYKKIMGKSPSSKENKPSAK